jgi:predicted RNA-binding Zn ribbon-like protein
MQFAFVGGNSALDLIGTLGERATHDVERLTEPADLARWITEADVVDELVGEVSAADLRAAKALREALHGVVTALIAGSAPPRRATALVNAAAAGPPPVPHVSTGGRLRRTGDVAAALSAVARAGLALFEPDDRAVLRMCADRYCTHPFLDRSRGHRRRWCGMAGCGDRAKAAAYRRRHRAS